MSCQEACVPSLLLAQPFVIWPSSSSLQFSISIGMTIFPRFGEPRSRTDWGKLSTGVKAQLALSLPFPSFWLSTVSFPRFLVAPRTMCGLSRNSISRALVENPTFCGLATAIACTVLLSFQAAGTRGRAWRLSLELFGRVDPSSVLFRHFPEAASC